MVESLARPEAPWALRLLPPFPAIAHRILALASQQDVNIQELANLVKMDPSFGAELLRLANSRSSTYSARSPASPTPS